MYSECGGVHLRHHCIRTHTEHILPFLYPRRPALASNLEAILHAPSTQSSTLQHSEAHSGGFAGRPATPVARSHAFCWTSALTSRGESEGLAGIELEEPTDPVDSDDDWRGRPTGGAGIS
eukprot:COSAG02_NODE_22818_length_739_cov_1.235937_1_plen_119_part_01